MALVIKTAIVEQKIGWPIVSAHYVVSLNKVVLVRSSVDSGQDLPCFRDSTTQRCKEESSLMLHVKHLVKQ